jgi:hypothetical protein
MVASILKAVKDGEVIKPPRTVFLPSKDILRLMIKAQLVYGKKDPTLIFLLRFGLISKELGNKAVSWGNK